LVEDNLSTENGGLRITDGELNIELLADVEEGLRLPVVGISHDDCLDDRQPLIVSHSDERAFKSDRGAVAVGGDGTDHKLGALGLVDGDAQVDCRWR